MRIKLVSTWDGNETRTDSNVAELCTQAFESAWNIAVPHNEYHLK